jgi:D-proline reductase (dithiol) PrdB
LVGPVEYIPRIRQQYSKLGYQPYQWASNPEPPPWQPLRKPLAQSRLALLASGGIYMAGQVAFHHKDDPSLRAIPKTVATPQLRVTHFAYDKTAARSDPNVVFPIDTLRALVAEGFIGGMADHAYTFMGGIYSARRVREELAPRITQMVLAEHADLALLVPV